MRLAPVLAVAAVATAAPPRGFLLVATKLPVQLLQRDADTDWRRDELGGLLRDICAQRKYPATVVVGDGKEADHVERNRPCDHISARLLPDRRRLNLREDGSIFPMRLFKVRAIAAFCNIYAEGTLYIDNDVQLRLPVVDELFAIFDTMRAQVHAADRPRPLRLLTVAQPPQEARGAQVAADDGVRLPRAAARTGPAAPPAPPVSPAGVISLITSLRDRVVNPVRTGAC